MVLPIRNVKSLQDMENQVGVGFADRAGTINVDGIGLICDKGGDQVCTS
ncbi:hypothetical protein PPTG_21818 [Phytophthora nicotianae INRA-310]|uniref:Uncharacterized protein n=1 Tax=Phytophthora nicotianae (strain INRA-310) TaxID=761204 RepID=W2QVD3_PHYN3|nr:hypothetical protein PPTG_21818 [Phytophthora nicotianae INRA-310]ETN17088.1 hypothetical protein PPTG_21818 [Phytophthora nicotianae INRA-310]